MGFVISKNEVFDKENPSGFKQHINLSFSTYDVIQHDMFAFDEKNISAFINQVFERYYQIANASINYRLYTKKEEIESLLSDVYGDHETKQRIINKLIINEKETLLQERGIYRNGKQLKIWIRKDTSKILMNCIEDKIYKKSVDYLKCVVEEYAKQPYVQRERIYFSPRIKKIKQGIDNKKQLRIVMSTGSKYNVYPYQIMCDPLNTVNYLVGFSKKEDDITGEKIPCSFRICALKSVDVMESRSACLKKAEKNMLEQKIAHRGVQFMIGDEREIHIRLTEEGVKKLKRYLHLRPRIGGKRGDVFVFYCTEAQAEYYFLKFGKDAEVLSPIELRKKVMTTYQEAISNYCRETFGGEL